MKRPRHAFTVDVEDWYHDADGWAGGASPIARQSPRVDGNVRRLLDVLGEARAHATFFFLGEVAERFPALVRDVGRAGHEIASHGYRHRPLRALLRREFREDVRRSYGLLSDLVGAPISGYRAPYFSLKAGVRWPLDVLAEEGFAYDSSILPIDRLPGLELVSPRSPYALRADLWEVPIAVSRFGFWHLPMLGGFALRALPEAFVRRRLEQFEAEIGPAVLHVHPWEIDPGAPEAESVPRAVRGLKRVGRKGLAGKLRRLLRAYSFGSIAEVFPESRGAGARPIAAKLAPSA